MKLLDDPNPLPEVVQELDTGWERMKSISGKIAVPSPLLCVTVSENI